MLYEVITTERNWLLITMSIIHTCSTITTIRVHQFICGLIPRILFLREGSQTDTDFHRINYRDYRLKMKMNNPLPFGGGLFFYNLY